MVSFITLISTGKKTVSFSILDISYAITATLKISEKKVHNSASFTMEPNNFSGVAFEFYYLRRFCPLSVQLKALIAGKTHVDVMFVEIYR